MMKLPRPRRWAIIFFGLGLLSLFAGMASALQVDALFGTAWHAPLPARIAGEDVQPAWETRPFAGAPYYVFRLGWSGREVELVHDKMYLANPSGQVNRFESSDGFNLLLLNDVSVFGPFELRAGAGMVITHPEGDVGGRIFGDRHDWRSFYVAGLAMQLAATYRRPLNHGLSLLLEAKGTSAFAVMEPLDTHLFHAGAHVLAGMGYSF